MKAKEIREKFKIDHGRMIIDIIKTRTEDEIEEVKQYYEELESKFASDKRRLSKRYDEKVRNGKLSLEIQYQLNEYFSEEYYIIENISLKAFRYSIIVTIYSLLESSLNNLCHFLHNLKKLTLSLEELRGAGIERAKLYLTKVCLIDFSENSNEWNEILKLNKIRNCIVHAQGDILNTKNPNKLRKIVAKTTGIGLESRRFIKIKSEYINTTLYNTKKLLEAVYDKSFDTV